MYSFCRHHENLSGNAIKEMLEMNIKMNVTVLGFLLLIVMLLALGGGLLFLLTMA
jgi:hypothetical protein